MFDLQKTMKEHGGLCKYGDLDARIICSDLNNDDPIAVAVKGNHGDFVITCALDGSTSARRPDITTLPETKISYVNLYCNDGFLGLPDFGVSRRSLKEAVESSASDSLGIYKVLLKGDDFTFEKVEL